MKMNRIQEQLLHLSQMQQATQCPSETEQLGLPSLICSLLWSNPAFTKQVKNHDTHFTNEEQKQRN